MADKPMAESTNAGDVSDPVPSPRAAEPEPAGDRPAKATRPARASKIAKTAKAAKKQAGPTKATRAGATKATKGAAAERPGATAADGPDDAGTPAKKAPAAKASKTTTPARRTKAAKKATPAPKKAAKRVTKKTATPPAASAEPPAAPVAPPPVPPTAEPPAEATAPASVPASDTPAVPATPSPAAPTTPASLVPAHPGAWVAAVREAVTRPDQPPQQFAELVVAELGPRAAAWAAWLRETYPDPPAHGIARLATREAGQLSRALALVEVTGPATIGLFMAGMFWVRATVVLRIAAAYGHDPADPRRAADLIELLGLHTADEPPSLRRLQLAGLVAASIAVARRTPVRAALFAMMVPSGRAARIERLAHRAARFYRAGAQSSSASISPPNNS